MFFNILPKEKTTRQTVKNIIIVYLISTTLLILALGIMYFNIQKQQLLQSQKSNMEYKAKNVIDILSKLHSNSYRDIIEYPEFKDFKTAIYDIDKNMIFSKFNYKIIDFNNKFYQIGDNEYFIYDVKPYYLGAKYLVIEQKSEYLLMKIAKDIIVSILILLIFLLITSVFLAKIIVKPLDQNIKLLDRFIKDTTHELNTPVSAILANIEMINLDNIDNRTKKKINRIKIGAVTISSIYDDLVYLVLNDERASKNELLDISSILDSRIEYFKILANAKKLSFNINITPDIYLTIDKLKMTRLIDNILSNAIKYTKISSTITVILDKNSLIIEDEGNGMSREEIDHIFERYQRFDTTVGGFGIGYSIVYKIVKEYNININIDSEKGKGTKVALVW